MPGSSSQAAPSLPMYAEPTVSKARAAIIRSWSSPWSIAAIFGVLNCFEFSHLFMARKYASANRQKHLSFPDILSSNAEVEECAKA